MAATQLCKRELVNGSRARDILQRSAFSRTIKGTIYLIVSGGCCVVLLLLAATPSLVASGGLSFGMVHSLASQKGEPTFGDERICRL